MESKLNHIFLNQKQKWQRQSFKEELGYQPSNLISHQPVVTSWWKEGQKHGKDSS